jgi:hypothetical protein
MNDIDKGYYRLEEEGKASVAESIMNRLGAAIKSAVD